MAASLAISPPLLMLEFPYAAVRIFQEAELEAPPPVARPVARAMPRLASESAAQFKIELAEMKRILDSQGAKLPPERFDETNAELLRFAMSAGLLQVCLKHLMRKSGLINSKVVQAAHLPSFSGQHQCPCLACLHSKACSLYNSIGQCHNLGSTLACVPEL